MLKNFSSMDQILNSQKAIMPAEDYHFLDGVRFSYSNSFDSWMLEKAVDAYAFGEFVSPPLKVIGKKYSHVMRQAIQQAGSAVVSLCNLSSVKNIHDLDETQYKDYRKNLTAQIASSFSAIDNLTNVQASCRQIDTQWCLNNMSIDPAKLTNEQIAKENDKLAIVTDLLFIQSNMSQFHNQFQDIGTVADRQSITTHYTKVQAALNQISAKIKANYDDHEFKHMELMVFDHLKDLMDEMPIDKDFSGQLKARI